MDQQISEAQAARATSPWQHIYQLLHRDIFSGMLERGARLPSERQLCERFNVTRMTVRRALSALQSEGLVTPRKGIGVFVRGTPSTYQITDGRRFIDSIKVHGATITTKTLSITYELASAYHAKLLGLPSNAKIILVKRLRLIDEQPVFLNYKRLPAALFPRFDDIYAERQSVHDVYCHHNITNYWRIETRISGGFASAEEAEALSMAPATPLLYSSNLNKDESGRIIESSSGCWQLTAVEFVFPGGSSREVE